MSILRKPEAQSVPAELPDTRVPFGIFVVFLASWFLRIPARVPALGILSIDLVLVAILAAFAIREAVRSTERLAAVEKMVFVLLLYVVITIPLVEWPGSVAKIGLLNYIKAVVFLFFTSAFVRTERQAAALILAFVSFQCFRVLEPVFMHLTQGYWGSRASLNGGEEFMNRLAGSPFDVINPNGLAYVACTTLPFLYYLGGYNRLTRLAAICAAPLVLYGMVLTGSRSGLLGLAAVCCGIVLKSRHRLVLGATVVFASIIIFSFMSSEMQDRYLSAFGGGGGQNAATANERMEGIKAQTQVVYRRPWFGHGLGTSAEANYHFSTSGPYGGRALPAHNIYLEVAQELGLIGLALFLIFMWRTVSAVVKLSAARAKVREPGFLGDLTDALQVWLFMSLIFSFFSYGLSSFDWYFFGGMSVVLVRLFGQRAAAEGNEAPSTGTARRGRKRMGRGGAAAAVRIRN